MIKTSPRAMGMVFALAMLVVAIICFRNYYIQLGQTDWIAATATVTQVKEDYDSTANGDYNIFYDIYYTYTVGGQPYNGMIDDMNQSLSVGETIDIKYDPDAPDHSTDVTKPAKSVLIMGIIFGIGGLLWLGSHIRSIVREKRGRRKTKRGAAGSMVNKKE